MASQTVLIPLPPFDYDPTEVSVIWQTLTELGHRVIFSTPDGRVSSPDSMMLTGVGLDWWSPLPLLSSLPLVGLLLRANADAREAHAAMAASEEYLRPVAWSSLALQTGDALFLPGGHKKEGMVPYLESEVLQKLVVEFFGADKVVASICHGSLLVARSIDSRTGKSVLYGRKVTALTWKLEESAWTMNRIFRFWDPNYYRTYLELPGQPPGHMSVQSEITRLLASPADFLDVEPSEPHFRAKTSGLSRDSRTDETPAHVVRDGFFVSGRWPGDAFTLAKTMAAAMEEKRGSLTQRQEGL